MSIFRRRPTSPQLAAAGHLGDDQLLAELAARVDGGDYDGWQASLD